MFNNIALVELLSNCWKYLGEPRIVNAFCIIKLCFSLPLQSYKYRYRRMATDLYARDIYIVRIRKKYSMIDR